ncbi:pyridoxamine 5'-phosphate oxidase family protein [Streptomyces benahoarensis]|uniref:Pyridoxamine 5'-phosphate oxidase family protein n=1 Tax=Streptomyces benahoarensis TaxID=2595054 RepID=A0A553ZNP7_9ACTN|nr:pyridoxamine 5'-phosphate oxidase family protein [Streptomyces benahoarensis]TSB26148.1 pyridoxamine 5'-phosphate oxidase family protein [Streptomyces benahoarensis]TSB43094.1 pyridoxamine 5'-phosphate oxidase family protein [Streptomyces benahoarensis]
MTETTKDGGTADTQRHGRRIMMTADERDAFLTVQRTCRVATVSENGAPHIGALWFVWDDTALWLYSLTRSKRWRQLRNDPRLSVVIDDGEAYGALRGVELSGRAVFLGEAPRTGQPCPELDVPERLFASKYFDTESMPHDGRHAWLRLVPDSAVSWDFRKMPRG